ncbi:C39 family peptidase, partial [Leuconostoc mesenteroides]|uniref:C39 family peptidase n=1 Tax=Leuconostoc mesenteroides TaxID=1245 RepID=UPI0021BE01BF
AETNEASKAETNEASKAETSEVSNADSKSTDKPNSNNDKHSDSLNETTISGMKTDNNETYYYKNKQLQKGSQLIDGHTYYFDTETGVMKKDYFEFTTDNKVYYYGLDGIRYTDQFYVNWGKIYYFGNDGARYTNQFYGNWGKTYYFGNDGARYTNHFYGNWGKTYYFGNDGARYTNQFYVNWGKTYYFGNDGARYTNQFYVNWGKTYYFGNDGARYTNQFYGNWGNTYYFGDDGARYTNQFYSNWGNKYYFDGNGILTKNKIFMVNNIKYASNDKGILSVQSLNKPYYYSQFNPEWSQTWFNDHTFAMDGCVPTSIAMVLKGSYNINVNPRQVANTINTFHDSVGATGIDLQRMVSAYGYNAKSLASTQAKNALIQGTPLIVLVNVGIGHAVVLNGYSNGATEVFDPYDKKFYNGWYSLDGILNRLSNDPHDWDAGTPVFSIS